MKLSSELNSALCVQISHEMSNSLKYMQLASYFEDLQLVNIAAFFKEQSKHENDHAFMFMDHINARTGGKVKIRNLGDIEINLNSIDEIADTYVKLEEETSASIEAILNLAISQKSYMDLPFLQKMLEEQVEEEDSANQFATNIKNVKDLVLFDKEMEQD